MTQVPWVWDSLLISWESSKYTQFCDWLNGSVHVHSVLRPTVEPKPRIDADIRRSFGNRFQLNQSINPKQSLENIAIEDYYCHFFGSKCDQTRPPQQIVSVQWRKFFWDVVRKSLSLAPKHNTRINQGHPSIVWVLKTIGLCYCYRFTMKPGRYNKSFAPADEISTVTTYGTRSFLLSMELFEKTKAFIRF